jgi:hypothetical protein
VADVKAKIETALKRSAEVDARRINVAVADGKVTLTGNVHSWAERNEARYAAWGAPGVKEVDGDRSVTTKLRGERRRPRPPRLKAGGAATRRRARHAEIRKL